MNRTMKASFAAILFLISIISISFVFSEDEQFEETDAQKFKSEYEIINGEKASGEYNYLTITIPENNPIVYVSTTKLLTLLDNGTGIIFFGNSKDINSRRTLPILLDAAEEQNVNKIYYFDITNIMDEYELNDGEVVLKKKAGENYKNILKSLDSILSDYTLVDSEGKVYSMGEKRVSIPTYLFIKNGNIEYYYVPDFPTSDYNKLDDVRTKEIFDLFSDAIEQIADDSFCDEKC